MKKFKVTVNGKSYEVDVEELGTAAPAAPVTPAPAPGDIPGTDSGTGISSLACDPSSTQGTYSRLGCRC